MYVDSVMEMALEMLEPVSEGIFSRKPKFVDRECSDDIAKTVQGLVKMSGKSGYERCSVNGDITTVSVKEYFSVKNSLRIRFTNEQLKPDKIFNYLKSKGYEIIDSRQGYDLDQIVMRKYISNISYINLGFIDNHEACWCELNFYIVSGKTE